MKALRLIITSAAILGAQESQPDVRIGDLRFKTLPGWSRVEKQNVTALVPPGLPPGKTTYLALFPAADLNSSLREWFEGQWKTITLAYQVLQSGRATPQTENGLESIGTTATVSDRAGTRWVLVFRGIQNGKRVEPLLFMSSALDPLRRTLDGPARVFHEPSIGPIRTAPAVAA
jgi:hypothetical protein